jgi:RNA polymerase sigma factor (sigma-70 family)
MRRDTSCTGTYVIGPISSGNAYERLCARIQAKDAAAEEEFCAMFERRIRSFGMANTGDPDLAEELIQDVLWAVIRSLREGRVQNPAQLPAFVYGSARNLLNDRLRKRSREKCEAITDEMEPSRPAVEQQDFERKRAAHQAIEALEPHERSVLLLSLVDGLRPEEIAGRLGITYDTVRQRKSRALKKLGELLSPVSQMHRPRLLDSVDRP